MAIRSEYVSKISGDCFNITMFTDNIGKDSFIRSQRRSNIPNLLKLEEVYWRMRWGREKHSHFLRLWFIHWMRLVYSAIEVRTIRSRAEQDCVLGPLSLLRRNRVCSLFILVHYLEFCLNSCVALYNWDSEVKK